MTFTPEQLDKIRAVLGDDAVAKLEAAERPADPMLAHVREIVALWEGRYYADDSLAIAVRGRVWDNTLAPSLAYANEHLTLRDTPATPVTDDDGWITWCATADSVNPVPGETVSVKLRAGGEIEGVQSRSLNWAEVGDGTVVRYRIMDAAR